MKVKEEDFLEIKKFKYFFIFKEFLDKEAEKVKEREDAKKAKHEKRKAELEKRHIFHDPKYEEQKSKIAKDLDDAFNIGLESEASDKNPKSETASTSSEASKNVVNKKADTTERFKDWMGVDVTDSDEEEEEEPIKKKCKTSL